MGRCSNTQIYTAVELHRIISIPLLPPLRPPAHCHPLLLFLIPSLICIIYSLLLKLKTQAHTHSYTLTDGTTGFRCSVERECEGNEGKKENVGKINTHMHNNTIIILGSGLGTNLGKTLMCQLTAPNDLPKPAGDEHTVAHMHTRAHAQA